MRRCLSLVRIICLGIIFGCNWGGIAPVAIAFPPAAESVLMAASFETIQQRGILRVGVKDNLRPLGFRNPAGELQGFEIALAKQLALQLLGDETAISLIPLKNQERLAALLNGEVDLVIAHMSENTARARVVDFTTPYYQEGTGIVTNNPKLRVLTDFQTRRIAVLSDSSTVGVIKQILPQAALVGVSSFTEAYELLETGLVDGFAGDNTVLIGWSQANPSYHHFRLPSTTYPLAIVLPRGLQYVELKVRLEFILRDLEESNWLPEERRRWGL